MIAEMSHAFSLNKHHHAPVITAKEMQGALFIDALSVPSPQELFTAINKVSRPNWTTFDHAGNAPVTTNRAQLALAIGVFVTNGYMALQAEDGQQVKNMGRDMMLLSKALGVSQTILSRGNNLIEFADNHEWKALEYDLEATENDVKSTMITQQDQSLITLISVGLWLRALEVGSQIILSHYSSCGAALLKEPDLALDLAASMEALPLKVRTDPLVLRAQQTLREVAALLTKEKHGLSKEDLTILEQVTKKIVTDITVSNPSIIAPQITAPIAP